MFYKMLLLYLVIINVISAVICIIDKISAIYNGWRISEKSLWLFCLLGGGVGMYFTMQIIRHKTKHKSFMIGIPAIVLLQVLSVILVINLIN